MADASDENADIEITSDGAPLLKAPTVTRTKNTKNYFENRFNKVKDKISPTSNLLFSSPLLNELSSQWVMTFVWFLVGLISIGVVWESSATVALKIADCELDSENQKNAQFLMLIILVHFFIFCFCFYRIKSRHAEEFQGIMVPFVGYYGCFESSQMLFKMTILITSGLGIASALRSYYLLSDPTSTPVFTEESGLLFMLNIVLFGFLGIYQMKKEEVESFYLAADIDIRFWKSKEAMSQFLFAFFYVVVFGMFIVHAASYKIPFNCVEGMDAGRNTVIVFGVSSFAAQAVCVIYMFINRRESKKDYDTIDIAIRNILGLASHVLIFTFFIYIILYFASALGHVGNS